MKLSNRVLGLLLLISIIGAFYIIYQIFFKIKLVNFVINSNIETFTGTLENIKFSKEFKCSSDKCTINNIPPFEYKLSLFNKDYKFVKEKINLAKNKDIDVFFEKNIFFKKLKVNKVSKREMIIEDSRKKIDFGGKKINYKNIIGEDSLVYFVNNGNIVFYNLKNNTSFEIEFKPQINYIKKISNNKFIINTKIGSFTFYILNKKIEYFSLFSDFIVKGNNYIGIINNDDKIRKKNLGYEKELGNLIIIYNFKNKQNYILKNLENKVNKIYILNNIIFIEDNIGNKFEINGI